MTQLAMSSSSDKSWGSVVMLLQEPTYSAGVTFFLYFGLGYNGFEN